MNLRTHSRPIILSFALFVLFAIVTALGLPVFAGDQAASATCSVPKTITTADGNDVELDQCYATDFDYGGDTYDVLVYYTEDPTPQNEVGGVEQCTPEEAAVNFCEHALPDDDVPGTDDNLYAVQVADSAVIALPYYFDRGFPIIDPETFMEIYITEDKDNGWIGAPNILKLDDEYVATTNDVKVLANVYHEGQHLIQEKYNDDVGWESWFTEGLARTSQDRTSTDYDMALSSSYLNNFNDILQDDNGVRGGDLLSASYRATAWWTWFMDQYKTNAEVEPGLGWVAVKGYYVGMPGNTDGLAVLDDYLVADQSSSFKEDFLDYTLALYAYIYNPADPRLAFIDAEINSEAVGLSGHTVVSNNQAYSEQTATVQPRSSQYWEYIPPGTCPFVAFTFEENDSSKFGFSVMTVDNSGDLQDRWTSLSSQWARTVSTSGLSRVVGVISGLEGDPDSNVTIGHGCVTPDLQIKAPTSGVPAYVGEADNPRQFQVRLAVTGQNGSGVGGLLKEDFIVELLEPGGGATIPAEVVTAAYVGDNYWLNVQAPDDFDGAQTGQFYHLHVTLEGLDDQQNNAVLYVERQVDKLIVLDRSGSMADQGRIEAARNAASLMTYELSDDDQGAYIRYDDTAELSNGLEPMDGNQMINMALDIQGTNPGGATCIGCGLQTAADEEDDDGLEDNLCVIALLSDGYENSAPFWADVEAEVADNECYMDVIGLGSQANEALLQQISTSSVGGGNYDFAPTSGDVPIDTDAAPAGNAPEAVQADASWQNYLSRAFDAIAIRATGRQRIFSAVGNNSTGDNPAVLPFMVDPTTDELVVSIAWQTSTTDQFIRLIDPDGVTLPLAGHQTIIEGDTAEVWRVIAPKDGEWSVLVRGLPQEFHVSASARTLLEMQIYATPPDDYMEQGAKVPIVATFSGSGQPILGAVVKARVTNPSGQQKLLMLYDDGLHADMEADDGVYGNWYTQTTGGEEMVEDPTSYEDGEEPNSRGSYLVQGMATWMDLRREDQTSFFLYEGEDSDGDGYPDRWEEDHDLDPDDPTTPDGDPDGDGLPTRCEWNQGTAPNNPDTDGGGESDGSEVPNCQPGTQDPLDPSDDRIEPLRAVLTSPEAQPDGRPYVKLWLAGLPLKGADLFDVYRRPGNDDDAPWRKVAEDIPAPTFTSVMTNVLSVNAPDPIYRVVPHSAPRVVAGVVQETITGGGVTTAPVPLSSDPYPPSGSIIIAEEPETRSRQVTLLLSANDSGPGHGDFDAPKQPPGTPPTELEMILSTNKAFSDASWQLFQPEVSNFDLGNVQPGEYVTVYVRFRDKAGNISDGFEESATIRYTGSTGYELYLPIIHR